MLESDEQRRPLRFRQRGPGRPRKNVIRTSDPSSAIHVNISQLRPLPHSFAKSFAIGWDRMAFPNSLWYIVSLVSVWYCCDLWSVVICCDLLWSVVICCDLLWFVPPGGRDFSWRGRQRHRAWHLESQGWSQACFRKIPQVPGVPPIFCRILHIWPPKSLVSSSVSLEPSQWKKGDVMRGGHWCHSLRYDRYTCSKETERSQLTTKVCQKTQYWW